MTDSRLKTGWNTLVAHLARASMCALVAVLSAPGAHAVCLNVAEIAGHPGASLARGDAGDGLGGTRSTDDEGLGGTGASGGDEDGIGGTGLRPGTDGIGGTGLAGKTDGIGGTGLDGESDGIGGTGLRTNGDGMGGTGLHANAAEGIGGTGRQANAEGIGGTGRQANAEGIGGTGVVLGDGEDPATLLGLPGMSDDSLGRVRASGDTIDPALVRPDSLLARIVSIEQSCDERPGLALHANARIEEGLESRTASALRVGHVVWIETEPGSEGAIAARVALRPIVEGPVAHVDVESRRIEVMGELVEIAADAALENEAGDGGLDLETIRLGDSVIVHGVRGADGHIHASYVGLRARSPFARIQGIVAPDPVGAPGRSLRVGAVRIETSTSGSVPVGQWVEVHGRWDAGSRALVDARVVDPRATGLDGSAAGPKGSRSGSRLHLGQSVPVSTR